MLSPHRRSTHPLRPYTPLLALIVLLIILHLAQVVFKPKPIDPETFVKWADQPEKIEALLNEFLQSSWDDPWMCTPEKVVTALKEIRSGTISYDQVQPLLSTFTCNFLHADFGHLIGNLVFFWIFGALCLELLGTRWLFIIIATTALGASTVQILGEIDSPIRSLGASGLVTGFEGAYLGLATRWRLPNPHIWPIAHPIPPTNLVIVAIIGISIDLSSILSFSNANIAFGAHIGGFVTGLLVTGLFAPKPRTAIHHR